MERKVTAEVIRRKTTRRRIGKPKGTKTMKISNQCYSELDKLRGHNGCRTFNEVIRFLVFKLHLEEKR